MPKIIELTVEIDVLRVSCPGVWLCQNGRVSLTVFALGTNYQTCLLPPMFPLTFKDIFYFRKRFQESCAVNNMFCLLKEETIYCELVQWSADCVSGNCTLLAQYLGALNDVLFPPNMCSNDGVDLLMRRAKDFPGILSPKIEITTKVRIDEVWHSDCHPPVLDKGSVCHCPPNDSDGIRQRQVCHTPQYHRHKCFSEGRRPSSEPRARSESSRSVSSFLKEPDVYCRCRSPSKKSEKVTCECSKPSRKTDNYACNETSPCMKKASKVFCECPPVASSQHRGFPRRHLLSASRPRVTYNVYNAKIDDGMWMKSKNYSVESNSTIRSTDTEKLFSPTEEKIKKVLLESRYIEQEISRNRLQQKFKKIYKPQITPCVCEICKRYHELFHKECRKIDKKV